MLTKHELFAAIIVLPEESRDDLVKIAEKYINEYKPVGATEEDYITNIIDLSWRIRRISRLESEAIADAKSPAATARILNQYARATQQLNTTLRATIAELKKHQAPRIANYMRDYRACLLIYDMHKNNNNVYDPAEHKYLFTRQQMETQHKFNRRWQRVVNEGRMFSTTKELDERHAWEAYDQIYWSNCL